MASSAERRSSAVAVFGSSEPLPGSELYERARRVGSLLARAGFTVVSGGYGGVMEGASRGAREADGEAIGVTTAIFSGRGGGNAYLSLEESTPDLFERTRRLMERSAAFIILPGKAGTLAELTFLWALNRAGLLGGRPIVLLGPEWSGVVEDLVARGLLDRSEAEATRHTESTEEAVEIVRSEMSPA